MEILSDPTSDMLAMPRFDDGAIDMQELLRRLAEQVVNAVMDAEADQLCGDGANSRNGYLERGLATCVGTLTLRIPKLRSGSFFLDANIEVPRVRPLGGSLVRLAGSVICEQDEILQGLRYFSEAKMAKLYDEGRTRGVDGTVDWARLDAETRKMIESGLELADRIGAA